MSEIYYTPPKDSVFEEVKQKARDVWGKYDNTYGYVDEKTKILDRLQNVGDNVMYIVSMFDHINQAQLASLLDEESRLAIRERMVDGGTPTRYIPF